MTTPHDNGLPRRRARVLVPLHGGLGFGSEAIRARALEVAREAQEQATRNVKAVAEAPLAGAAATKHTLTKHTATLSRQIVHSARARDPLAFAPEGDERSPAASVAGIAAVVPPSVGRVSHLPSAAATAALRARQGSSARNVKDAVDFEKVTRVRAFAGVALDFVVAACVVLLAGVVNYALGTHALAARIASLATREPAIVGLVGGRAAWLAFGIQLVLTAAPALFLCQFVSVSFFRSTLGRFVVGIELARAQGRSAAAVCALAEVLACGGIFALPFVLLTPKRMPIFPWLRLVKGV